MLRRNFLSLLVAALGVSRLPSLDHTGVWFDGAKDYLTRHDLTGNADSDFGVFNFIPSYKDLSVEVNQIKLMRANHAA